MKPFLHRLPTRVILLFMLTAAVLSACGGFNPAAAMEQGAGSSCPTPAPCESAAGLPAPAVEEAPGADEARQSVVDFLTALQLDANSSLAVQMLSPALQAKASRPEGVQAALLNTAEAVPTFEVSAAGLSRNGARADVEATLFYGEPENLAFTLHVLDGVWKIHEVRSLVSEADYPSTPEGVVQAFLIAYQERPDQMSAYLSTARRAAQPPGGSAGMLGILGALEGVVVQSAVVNPDPPTAVILVLIQSGGVESRRTFILIREGSLWGIEDIQPVE